MYMFSVLDNPEHVLDIPQTVKLLEYDWIFSPLRTLSNAKCQLQATEDQPQGPGHRETAAA